MPGYDRTGPLGNGPLTGWGMGRCGRPADETRAVGGPYRYGGGGGLGRRWGGGRGFGRGGRGRGWGFGMGWRGIDDSGGDDLEPHRRQASLKRRISELTAELDRLNQLLAKDSPESTQHEE